MSNVKLLKDKNYAPTKLGKVCVLGLGKTGNVVSQYLCDILNKRVSSVHVYAGDKKEYAMQAADKLLKLGATVSFDDKELNDHYDLCIASPGFPINSELLKSAFNNADEVISEIEFAWREADTSVTWVAITGTNGKTTTTSLLTHILKESGKHVESVGNIGNVALSAVASDDKKSKYMHTDIYVVEVSSAQLALCDKFTPMISVLLNITPDHIEWHGSLQHYIESKLKIFNNAKYAILNTDDEETNKALNTIKNNANIEDFIELKTSGKNIDFKYKNDTYSILSCDKLKIFGEHNYINAKAASSAAYILGLSEKQIANGLANFSGLEHRLEPCGIIAGVRMYNDTKATNVDATIVAINSFPKNKAIFMLGGHDKKTSLEELSSCVLEKLKGAICYGEAKDRFFDALNSKKQKYNKDSFLLEKAENMQSAFKIALENAFPGDFVVLSPACSSYDEFNSYEERGKIFKMMVEKCK